MQPSLISRGDAIAAAGGLLLLVLMFLNWFDVALAQAGSPIGVQEKTGWQAYGGPFDVLIMALAATPIGIAAAKAAGRLPPLPLEQGLMVLGAGALLALIVGARLIDPPDVTAVAIPGIEVDDTREIPAFLALAAAMAVAAGGHLQRVGRPTAGRQRT